MAGAPACRRALAHLGGAGDGVAGAHGRLERLHPDRPTELPVYLLVLVAFGVVFFRTVAGAAPWQAMALGITWIPLVPQLTGYYYAFPAASAALTEEQRAPVVDGMLLALALAGQLAAAAFFWADDNRVVASLAAVVWALLLPSVWARGRAGRAPARSWRGG